MKYRYRFEGSSSQAVKRFDKIIPKLGKIVKIRGYRYFGRYHTNHEAVMVYGTNGTARFSGLLWGYGGQGPRALVQLLTFLGYKQSFAEQLAFETVRKSELGTDWELHYDKNN